MRGRLKAIELAKLAPGKHHDGEGLYLNVEASGSRSWILRTVVTGKRRDIGLGSLSTVSLAEARVAAVNLRARARKGEDIVAERRAKKEAARAEENPIPTFESVALEYHKLSTPKFTSETHAHNWIQSLKTYVIPLFGKKPIDKIDSADILQAIGPMWNDVPDTAGRTLRRIKKVFDYAAGKKLRVVNLNGVEITLPNPCDSIRAALPKHTKAPKPHEALPFAELPKFMTKLRVSGSALVVKLAFEFLILTCTRTGEVLGARWDEIDTDAGVWTIPAERMKMSKEHRVPLSPRCLEILSLAKQFNDSAIVFPGRYAGHPLSNMAFLMALRRLGYEDLTAHGFRATFKTWAEETTKYDSLVIEACMAHAVKGIERHYLRTTFFDERQKLMKAWANFACGGSPAKARVVRMRT